MVLRNQVLTGKKGTHDLLPRTPPGQQTPDTSKLIEPILSVFDFLIGSRRPKNKKYPDG